MNIYYDFYGNTSTLLCSSISSILTNAPKEKNIYPLGVRVKYIYLK